MSREASEARSGVAQSAGWGHLRKQGLHVDPRKHPTRPSFGRPPSPRCANASRGREKTRLPRELPSIQGTNQLATKGLKAAAGQRFLVHRRPYGRIIGRHDQGIALLVGSFSQN